MSLTFKMLYVELLNGRKATFLYSDRILNGVGLLPMLDAFDAVSEFLDRWRRR